MLILLPPSEGKASTDGGHPFDLESLSLPELTATRRRVRDALVKLSSGRESRALDVLGLSARQVDELDRNRDLVEPHGLPSAQVYTGVLYAALDYGSLTPAARRRADRWILVFSALWGAVHLSDEIPAYRLSADVSLPRLGPVAAVWRKPLAAALPPVAGDGVVLDLRSGVYAKMWTPDADLAPQTAAARVLHQRPDGSRVVVSHFNKATKGRLVRALVSQTKTPRSVPALVDLISALGFTCEVREPRPAKPWSLDVVVDEL